ncbi:MAG: aminotransferase class I/II-fold pyridoxal phosphate-dependent enzyme [Bacteroidota bacterium]
MTISEIINQLGENRNQYFNAVAPPIIKTSNFCFPLVAQMRANIHNEFEVPFYTRGNNPTVTMLRKKLAALEQTQDALITSSGCAAISAAVFSVLSAGDHAICVYNCYSWTHTLFNTLLRRFNVQVTMVDGNQIQNFRNALRPNTKLIYLESPTSFFMELQDIRAVAQLAKPLGITTIIDNSYATPLYQNPAAMGIDMIVHSASKYLGGHSDLIAGAICASSHHIRQIFETEYLTFGGIITPDNAWLLLRGLRTLPVRLRHISQSTAQIVGFLQSHPKIQTVMWPFATGFAQGKLARSQMKGAGGLFSFVLRTQSISRVDAFCDALHCFLLACSWGGYESLVFPASVLYDSMNNNKLPPANLVRMYVELEDPNELIADLDQALHQV